MNERVAVDLLALMSVIEQLMEHVQSHEGEIVYVEHNLAW